MAFVPGKVLVTAIAAARVAETSRLTVMAGAVAAYMGWTMWGQFKADDAKATMRAQALQTGFPLDVWNTYQGDVIKLATKLATKMPHDPLVLAVRDADSEERVIQAMLDLFAVKGITFQHYVKVWAAQEDCGPVDHDAKRKAREAKDAAKAALMMGAATTVDASTLVAPPATDTKTVLVPALAQAKAALAQVASMAELVELQAALNARMAELQALADTAPATDPTTATPPLTKDSKPQRRGAGERKPKTAQGMDALASLAMSAQPPARPNRAA